MRVFIEQQLDAELLDAGYTVEVHVVPDGDEYDLTDVVDIRDFFSFSDALLWTDSMGYKVCEYQKL